MAKKGGKKRAAGKAPAASRAGRLWAWLAGIPFLGLAVFAYSWSITGAEELRSGVYQPLFADLKQLEEWVESVSPESPPALMKQMHDLEQSGRLERVPTTLRLRLRDAKGRAEGMRSASFEVQELVLRTVSARVTTLRSLEIDRAWRVQVLARLREEQRAKPGISEIARMEFSHEAHGRGYDVRGPVPIVSDPGGPEFVVRDWIEFPGSLQKIEALLGDSDLLFFNRNDAWYYTITREDLRRLNLGLFDFLKPMHATISASDGYKMIASGREPLRLLVTELKAEVTDRVRAPKMFRDWLPPW